MRTYSLTNPPQHGEDLKPLQQALQADRLYRGRIDGVFGQATGLACKQAKYRLGYPKSACVETGGQELLDYIDGKMKLPPTYLVRRRARGFGVTKAQRQRDTIVRYARLGVKDTAEIHYAEIRPIPHAWQLPMTTDCSGFVTLLYQIAGAPDPNGQGYDGLGYTGTLLDHGHGIALLSAKPGDLIVWGAPPGHHVAVLVDVSDHADPLIVSHGSEDGPLLERVSGETVAQQGRPFQARSYLG